MGELLKKIYEEYFSEIYNFIYFRVLSKALTEELVSLVFLKIAGDITMFDEKTGSLKAWVYDIANKTIIENASKIRESSVNELENIVSEDRKALYVALTELDEPTRTIISLKCLTEMSMPEIARGLEMNEKDVKVLHDMGMKKLNTRLNENVFAM